MVKRNYYVGTVLIIAALSTYGCNQASFSDKTQTKGPQKAADPILTPTNVLPVPTDKPCIDGDKVNFKFEASAQACMDSGKIWDFESKSCTTVPQATSYKCTWADLEAAATKLLNKPVVNGLADAKAKGAKLVSCGEKSNGDVLMAQWVVIPETASLGDCKYQSGVGSIIIACYINTTAMTPAMQAITDSNQMVQECFKLP